MGFDGLTPTTTLVTTPDTVARKGKGGGKRMEYLVITMTSVLVSG